MAGGVLIGTEDSVRIFNVKDQTWSRVVMLHPPIGIAIAENSAVALAYTKSSIVVLDWEDGVSLRSFKPNCLDLMLVEVSADGKIALSHDSDGTKRIWDVNTGLPIGKKTYGSATMSKDGDVYFLRQGDLSRIPFKKLTPRVDRSMVELKTFRRVSEQGEIVKLSIEEWYKLFAKSSSKKND